jgi:hypothetical protein
MDNGYHDQLAACPWSDGRLPVVRMGDIAASVSTNLLPSAEPVRIRAPAALDVCLNHLR